MDTTNQPTANQPSDIHEAMRMMFIEPLEYCNRLWLEKTTLMKIEHDLRLQIINDPTNAGDAADALARIKSEREAIEYALQEWMKEREEEWLEYEKRRDDYEFYYDDL